MTTYQISSNQLTNYYSLSLLKNNTNQLTKTINKKYISYVILWFSLLSFIFIFDLIIFCFYWWLISVLSLSISLFSLFWFDFKMSSHNLEQKKKKNKMMKSEKESGSSHLPSSTISSTIYHLPSYQSWYDLMVHFHLPSTNISSHQSWYDLMVHFHLPSTNISSHQSWYDQMVHFHLDRVHLWDEMVSCETDIRWDGRLWDR